MICAGSVCYMFADRYNALGCKLGGCRVEKFGVPSRVALIPNDGKLHPDLVLVARRYHLSLFHVRDLLEGELTADDRVHAPTEGDGDIHDLDPLWGLDVTGLRDCLRFVHTHAPWATTVIFHTLPHPSQGVALTETGRITLGMISS